MEPNESSITTEHPVKRIDPLTEKKSNWAIFLEYLLMTLGAVITAAGIYFFMFPSHFTLGGVSGMSVILGDLVMGVIPWLTPATFVLIINISLIIIGFLILGRDFGLRTFYCSVVVSGMTYIFEWVFPMDHPITSEPLLELTFAILLPAVGSAILFYLGASSGGTDIIAMIIKRFFHINISPALFVTDLLIVLCSFFTAESNTVFLCSFIGLLLKVLLVNNLLESINTSKYCTVVTTPACKETLCRFITDELHKGATVSEAFVGAYGKEKKVIILVALTRSQAARLRKFCDALPEKTFTIVTTTNEILGLGFRAPI